MPYTSPVLDQSALLSLRWVGTAVLLVVLAAGFLGTLPTPSLPIAGAVMLSAILLNLILQSVGPRATPWVLLCDTLVLTTMLSASGGISNPFTLLYLFPVVLAALVLSPAWTAVLALTTTSAFAGLWFTSPAHHHMNMSQHLIGMVVAYALTVPLLAGAVHRFRTAAAAAEQEMHLARQSRAVAERLASLAALAGGAAHDLSTPLSTILLIARELQRTSTGEQREDLDVIAAEVEQCRSILEDLAVDAGEGAGTSFELVQLEQLISEHVPSSVRVDASGEAELPARLIGQVLRRLVGNAHEADPDAVVQVQAHCEGGRVEFQVVDNGPGMSPEVLAHACEPFFTTKGVRGHGLGLFFVHSVASQLGGSFRLESTPGEGTRALLSLPGCRP